MIIVFYTTDLNHRGTGQALFDYAHYNETVLGNRSIIRYSSDESALLKFYNRFDDVNKIKLEELNEINNVDYIYIITYGNNLNLKPKVKLLVHCVFSMDQPYGHVYAGVSKGLAEKYNKTLFVPHIVPFPSFVDFETLKFPTNSTIVGRHGDYSLWNLEWSKTVICKVLNKRNDLFFIFLDTPKFINHERVIFMNHLSDISEKRKYLRTIDALLIPEQLGHTFGLSIAESSMNGANIIVYGNDKPSVNINELAGRDGTVWNRAHLDILGESCIKFTNERELEQILMNTKHLSSIERLDNVKKSGYLKYCDPVSVMKEFEKIFLI